MSDESSHGVVLKRGALLGATVAAALAIGAVMAAQPAFAQEKKAPAAAPAAKAAAPAAKDGAAADDKKQSAWVKLCEKLSFNTKDKDGKEAKEEKNICLTHHERLDGNTGLVIVSAAIRQVDGQDKQSLMIMLPLGMALPPGVKAAVYTKEQWQQAAKNEKIDEKALKPVDLKYSLCHNAGCTAEVEATPDLIEQMKAGGGLMVLAVNPALKPLGFPVPLDGFAEAFAGKPIDNKEYAKARGELMKQIRARQEELMKTYQKEQEEAKKAGEDLIKSDPNAKKDAAKAAPAQK